MLPGIHLRKNIPVIIWKDVNLINNEICTKYSDILLETISNDSKANKAVKRN
jgi:hypothetical protein